MDLRRRAAARRSTPRHPITMASTAEPPDPLSCALAAILLPESRAHGCHMQKGLFPGTYCVHTGTCVFGPFLRVGCVGAVWVRGGSLGIGMGDVWGKGTGNVPNFVYDQGGQELGVSAGGCRASSLACVLFRQLPAPPRTLVCYPC